MAATRERRSPRSAMPRFVAIFAAVIIAGHSVVYAPLPAGGAAQRLRQSVIDAQRSVIAICAAALLRVSGEPAMASGATLSSPRYALSLGEGCDAIPPAILIVAAVLAMPVGWRQRAAGIVCLFAGLQAVNILRVVTLFWVGILRPVWFNTMHLNIWPVVIVLLSVGGWMLWAAWAVGGRGRGVPPADHADATPSASRRFERSSGAAEVRP